MKRLLVSLGLLLGLTLSGRVSAQSPDDVKSDKDTIISTGRRLITPADLVHQRASREAQERDARIQCRQWHGISMQRPLVYAGPSAGIEFLYASPWQAGVYHRASYWDLAQ